MAITIEEHDPIHAVLAEMAKVYEMSPKQLVRFMVAGHYDRLKEDPTYPEPRPFIGQLYKGSIERWDEKHGTGHTCDQQS